MSALKYTHNQVINNKINKTNKIFIYTVRRTPVPLVIIARIFRGGFYFIFYMSWAPAVTYT